MNWKRLSWSWIPKIQIWPIRLPKTLSPCSCLSSFNPSFICTSKAPAWMSPRPCFPLHYHSSSLLLHASIPYRSVVESGCLTEENAATLTERDVCSFYLISFFTIRSMSSYSLQNCSLRSVLSSQNLLIFLSTPLCYGPNPSHLFPRNAF